MHTSAHPNVHAAFIEIGQITQKGELHSLSISLFIVTSLASDYLILTCHFTLICFLKDTEKFNPSKNVVAVQD